MDYIACIFTEFHIPQEKLMFLKWCENQTFLFSSGYRDERKQVSVALNYMVIVKEICFLQKLVEEFGTCPTLFLQTLRRTV